MQVKLAKGLVLCLCSQKAAQKRGKPIRKSGGDGEEGKKDLLTLAEPPPP